MLQSSPKSLGVVWPPSVRLEGVAEPPPKAIGGGSATPEASLRVVQPPTVFGFLIFTFY